MKIQVYDNGAIIYEITFDPLPAGVSEKDYNLRKAIIDRRIQAARELYPYEELAITFESKMHLVEITE